MPPAPHPQMPGVTAAANFNWVDYEDREVRRSSPPRERSVIALCSRGDGNHADCECGLVDIVLRPITCLWLPELHAKQRQLPLPDHEVRPCLLYGAAFSRVRAQASCP